MSALPLVYSGTVALLIILLSYLLWKGEGQ